MHKIVFMSAAVIIILNCCNTRIATEQDIGNNIIANIDMDSTAFSHTIQGFPKKILRYMQQESSLDSFVIANPSERFRDSDGIKKGEHNLPTRRLIFWNKNKRNCYTICYEQGGRSHTCVIAQFRTFPSVKNLQYAPLRMPVEYYQNIDSIFCRLKQGSIYYGRRVNKGIYY